LRPSKAEDQASVDGNKRLQQGFTTGEMGLELSLHGSNSEPLMSALGQKRTWDCRSSMSALPPKADIDECSALQCSTDW
jgi:hypothetical protein